MTNTTTNKHHTGGRRHGRDRLPLVRGAGRERVHAGAADALPEGRLRQGSGEHARVPGKGEGSRVGGGCINTYDNGSCVPPSLQSNPPIDWISSRFSPQTNPTQPNQGTRHLSVHDMRPVTEGNEITHHLLEAVFIHCCNTKGRPNKVRLCVHVRFLMDASHRTHDNPCATYEYTFFYVGSRRTLLTACYFHIYRAEGRRHGRHDAGGNGQCGGLRRRLRAAGHDGDGACA